MLSENVIQKIIGNRDDSNQELSILISKAFNTANLVQRLENDVEQERDRHNELIKKLKSKLASIQHDCTHLAKTYHPDASGNNDSYYSCDICGAEL